MSTNTITVTGCGDCPMRFESSVINICNHPDKTPTLSLYLQWKQCPLKTNSLTIQLKQNEQENI